MKYLLVLAVLAIVTLGAPQSAKADILVFAAALSGPAEAPPNTSPGVGFTTVTYDNLAHTLRVQVAFAGLTTGTVASHIHSATAVPFTGAAGVATQVPSFVGFPLGVTSGTFDNTLDLTLASSWNPAFIAANGGTTASAELAFVNIGLLQGRAYLNIHTTAFPGGEIRGFLQATPEPTTMLLLGTGLASLGAMVRRRSKSRNKAS